jgi:hypothetical protein
VLVFKVGFSDIVGIGGIVLTIVLLVLDKAGKLKGGWLYVLLIVAGAMTLSIAVGNSWVMDDPKWRLWRGTFAFAFVALLYSGVAIWISGGGEGPAVPPSDLESKRDPLLKSDSLTPSLLFVFGAPLGDNESASWIMMLKHYGPNSAYNCDIGFYDDDRKNIEHEWLVKHPNSPFPPPGLAGESQRRLYVPEAGPEGSAGSFTWNPVNPNRQHYTVSINCRDGVFEEKWEVTRVDGILRSTITIKHGPLWIEKNPNRDPVVLRCQDPEFVITSLATEMPKSSVGKVVHPGWKPNHRFYVPAAIIDSNGNIQVLSGVTLPDGSTATDFGCWKILTKHFGD